MYYHGWPPLAPFGIPRPAPLTVVVGAPVAPPPRDAPDRLGTFHADFCAAMEALVARHRGRRSAFGDDLAVRLI